MSNLHFRFPLVPVAANERHHHRLELVAINIPTALSLSSFRGGAQPNPKEKKKKPPPCELTSIRWSPANQRPPLPTRIWSSLLLLLQLLGLPPLSISISPACSACSWLRHLTRLKGRIAGRNIHQFCRAQSFSSLSLRRYQSLRYHLRRICHPQRRHLISRV